MRRSTFAQYLAALGCALALLTTEVAVSFAQEPDAKALKRARALFQQGIELEKGGNYPAALQTFREVGQVRMTPQVRYHIAFCEEKLGRLVVALGGYELALADAASVGKGFEKEVTTAIEDLRSRIPKLVIERGTGAEAATIEVDGVALGSAVIGTQLPVDPGPHRIEAKLGSKVAFSKTVEASEGQEQTIVIEIEAAEADLVAPPAGPQDTAPTRATESGPGALPWIIGGVGVVSLGASGAFFLMRNSKINELDEVCGPSRSSCPPEAKTTHDDAKRFDLLSKITLGVGVVGVGVGVTLLVTGKKDSSKPATGLRLVPAAPSADAGLSLSARF